MTSTSVITLFNDWCQGDAEAGDILFELIFDDLSKVARSLLKNERKVSLSTGDMVNETVLRLIKSENLSVSSAAHLKYLASRVMRNVLLDAIKKKSRLKHNAARVSINVSQMGDKESNVQVLEMENTLERLKGFRADLADITLMKVYGAMSNEDIAQVMDKTPEQVKYAWKTARIWLVEAIQEHAP